MPEANCDIGLIGLAVMGQNLVLNMNDHGYKVAVFNRTVSKVDDFLNNEASGTKVVGTHSLQELASVLKRPRRVMLMVKAGDTFAVDYRLYWQDDEPHPTDLARVVATRIGRGGVPGQPVPPNRWKFVIDFAGGPLATMAPRYDVKPVVTLSQGEVHTPYVVKVVGTDRWRAFFDVALQDRAAIDMRCYLRLGDRTLSETWLYQFYP